MSTPALLSFPIYATPHPLTGEWVMGFGHNGVLIADPFFNADLTKAVEPDYYGLTHEQVLGLRAWNKMASDAVNGLFGELSPKGFEGEIARWMRPHPSFAPFKESIFHYVAGIHNRLLEWQRPR
jgi:hypothetical protein